MQAWAEIVHDFEKRSVCLADCAQLLTRNVNYEIPALKQVGRGGALALFTGLLLPQGLARSQAVQQEGLKREQEAMSSAATLRAQFLSSCQEMGIKGEKVREELQELLSELSIIFERTLGLLPSLSPALQYYQSFIEHNTGRPVQQPQFLPMLHYLLQNGNVTVYQWKHGREPEVAGESSSGPEETEAASEADIDWGNLSEPGGQLEGSEVITWEDTGAGAIVVVEESGEAEEAAPNPKEREGKDGALAPGEGDLDSLLAGSATRALFLDDVMELKEFLWWRVRELSRDETVLMAQFSSEGPELERQGVEGVQEMLGRVTAVLDTLTSPRPRHLLRMRGSGHYLDRMASSLLSPQLLARKAQAQAEAAAARREEAAGTALALQPQLTALICSTRQLQRQAEQQISELYKQREVNIIGEINVTLQQ
jgi:hypothetical protein